MRRFSHIPVRGLCGVLLLAGIAAGGDTALLARASARDDLRAAVMNSICREPPAPAGRTEEQGP